MTWTGGGDDALWSNGANWGGTVPGAADTAVFDSTSAKACTVDVSQVLNLTIAADYTGTLTLANAFTVLNKHDQTGGTFTCGDFDYAVGASADNKNGLFTLTGGTFNAPSGNFTWLPHRQWSYGVVTIDGGTYNANGGNFIVSMTAPSHNGSDLYVYNTTFQNFYVRTIGYQGQLTFKMTNVVVRGDFHHEGGRLGDATWRAYGSSTNNWVRDIRLLGNYYVGKGANGGTMVVGMETADDQYMYFNRDGSTTYLPRASGIIVNKPNGKSVKVVTDDGGCWFGNDRYNSVRHGTDFPNLSTGCFSGIWVEHGTLDFSGATSCQVQCDNDTGLICATHDDAVIRWPRDVEFNYRLVQWFGGKTQTFTNLTLWSSGNCFAFNDYTTNTVLGNLELVGAGLRATADRRTSVALHGNLLVSNWLNWPDMGGQGDVQFVGAADQVMAITNRGCVGTVVLNKSGGKVTVDSQDGSPLMIAPNGSSANGGNLFLDRGEIVFPSEGVVFTNCHFTVFSQTDGTFSYESGCVVSFGHRYGSNYATTLCLTQALPSVVQTKGCTLNSSTGYPIRFGGDLTVEANCINGESEFVGNADQRYRTSVATEVFTKSGTSVSGGLKLAKTGGRFICESPVRGRFLTVADGSEVRVDIPATCEGAMFQMSGRVYLPEEGKVGLSVDCRKSELNTKWLLARDVIYCPAGVYYGSRYVGDKYGTTFRSDDWTFDLAEGLVRPVVTHDATAKMISFTCHRRRGLLTIVK